MHPVTRDDEIALQKCRYLGWMEGFPDRWLGPGKADCGNLAADDNLVLVVPAVLAACRISVGRLGDDRRGLLSLPF